MMSRVDLVLYLLAAFLLGMGVAYLDVVRSVRRTLRLLKRSDDLTVRRGIHKAGINPPQSQVVKRPPPPAPFRVK